MNKHTPGLWEATREFAIVVGGRGIANTGGYSNNTEDPDALYQENIANRDRIVSCVNACDGLAPEAVPDLLAACEAMERRLTDCANAFYVKGKRSALLAAFTGWKDDIEPARAAIAKAKSG